jgi:hypothetical protein
MKRGGYPEKRVTPRVFKRAFRNLCFRAVSKEDQVAFLMSRDKCDPEQAQQG